MIVPIVLSLAAGIPLELDAFLKSPNPAKSWTVASKTKERTEVELTSQVWQGQKWKHDLLIMKPAKPLGGGIAILYITGDRVDRADIPFIKRMADEARMPVVALFGIPNQPLYGKNEDALIAHTFEQYLRTGDASWPLLFPMTKAALAAMDAAQEIGGFKKFVVTGASKRGWTTWFAGVSGDKRIAGIAPMVYDNLNMAAQLKHQLEYYGKYSEMIGDYTEKGLTEVMNSEPGQKLAAMVDPYSYLPRLACPVLVVVGSNDRYWTVDSHTIYWDAIKTRKLLSVVPNAGHNLGDGKQATSSIAFFARACLGTLPGGFPTENDKRFVGKKGYLAASFDKRDFRNAQWSDHGLGGGPLPNWVAGFQSSIYRADGVEGTFSSPITVNRLGGG